MGLLEHCFHLQRQKADLMLQLGIMRRTLTSFGCPCQQHYCLQPLAKKIRTANLTQQHFRELEPQKMGLTAVNPQEELWKNHTKHLHHTLTLCCACRASHITVHVLPSGSLQLQHSVGAEGPLRTAAPWHLVHTCKSKCPWAALCPAQHSPAVGSSEQRCSISFHGNGSQSSWFPPKSY